MMAAATAVHMDSVATPDVFGPNGANYTNTSPEYDMSKIKIDITSKGDGNGDKDEKCMDGQWAKISYKGYLKNGDKIYDTDAEGGDQIFSVGAAQSFKCFDLALPQVKPGAKFHVECPSELVNGGASVQAPIGGEWIPKWSDVDFDVEVSFCNHTPGQYTGNMYWGDDLEFFNGPLKPGKCYKFDTIHPDTSSWRKIYNQKGFLALKRNYWGQYLSVEYNTPTGDAVGDSIFYVEKGLDGTKDTISMAPLSEKDQGMNLANNWCSF